MACADSSVEIGPLITSEDDATNLQVVAPSKFRVNKVASVILGAAVALVATAGVYKAWQYKTKLEVGSSGDATSFEEEGTQYVVDRADVAQPNPTPSIFYESVKVDGVPYYDGVEYNGLIGSPKSGSNPGVVIIPGKGGGKERHDGWVKLLAGRGVVALVIDISPANANDQEEQMGGAYKWFVSSSNPYKKYLKTSEISIMGYSAGAAKMNDYLAEGNSCLNGYKNFISISGIRKDMEDKFPASSLISGGGYLAVQATDDSDMGFNGVEPFVANVATKAKAAYALCYNTGGHQPSQNTNFFQQVAAFINNVNGYKPPYECDTADKNGGYNVGMAKEPTLSTGAKGSPLSGMAFNLWTSSQGTACCKGYCYQVKECTSYELKSSYNEDDQNCFLYR